MQMQQNYENQKNLNRQSWGQMAASIPSSKTSSQDIQLREEYWTKFDIQGKGHINIDEAQAGVRDVIQITDYLEIKPAIDLSFLAAKKSIPSSKSGPENIDK